MEQIVHRKPDRQWIRRALARIGQQQPHLKRSSTWRQKRVTGLPERLTEQLRKTREREGSLCFSTSACQDVRKAFPSMLDAHPPEGRLADPRIPRQNEPSRSVPNLVEKSLPEIEFGVAPDDRPRDHTRILSRNQPGCQGR